MTYEEFGDSMVTLGMEAGDGEDFMPVEGFIDDSMQKKCNLFKLLFEFATFFLDK